MPRLQGRGYGSTPPPCARRGEPKALSSYQISLRGAYRVMKLSWTICDLDGRTSPNLDDVDRALSLRTTEVN